MSDTQLISSWFTVDQERAVIENTKKYKQRRVGLGCMLREVFQGYNLPFFIEGGTALGAHRDGTMVPRDDDFDFGVYGDEESLAAVEKKLHRDLPIEYGVRMIQSYCVKIEVFDTRHGKMELHTDIDFHNVTVDLLLYKDHPRDEDCVQIQYFKRPYHELMFPKTDVFPLGEAKFEGEWFPCPGNQQAFLERYYGYIGEDACYDPKTNLYRQRDDNNFRNTARAAVNNTARRTPLNASARVGS